MTILLGGSGSTGSSLLRTILNRHPDIFSGPELNFFNKEQLFQNWKKEKKKIFNRFPQFITQGWVSYPGTHLLNKEYLWNKDELLGLIYNSETINSFIDGYYYKPLKLKNAKIWIEKTPSNSYSFDYFLRQFPEGRVIHSTRNPYDSVASLVKRGKTPFYATGMWVYNTISALRASISSRCMTIKYEDLVLNPKESLDKILSFINVKNDDMILNPQKSNYSKKIISWKHDPNREISKTSIGNFRKLSSVLQEEIITALSVFELSDKYMKLKFFKEKNCKEACLKLNYDFKSIIYSQHIRKIKRDFMRDYLDRSIRFYSTGWNNYPATIRF